LDKIRIHYDSNNNDIANKAGVEHMSSGTETYTRRVMCRQALD